jgi:hypothetical protein
VGRVALVGPVGHGARAQPGEGATATRER